MTEDSQQEPGFDTYEAIEGLQAQNKDLQSSNAELSQSMVSSNFDPQADENLIQYQLETDKILERIEHYLKGDQIKFNNGNVYFETPKKTLFCHVVKNKKGTVYTIDVKTNKIWKIADYKTKFIAENLENSEHFGDGKDIIEDKETQFLKFEKLQVIDDELVNFNKYGVAELMRILSMYVTKETFLSNYKEERINEIMGDLADALNNFWYCNYEKIGMTTKYKESKYHLIVLNILHVVESCYRRSVDGSEQENLRTRAIVTQSNNVGGMGGIRGPVQKPKFNPIDKSTW
jgi:hypothetical protein